MINVACANSYIVYNMMRANDLTMLDFKLFRPTWLEDTQVKAEQHQMTRKVLKEIIRISLIKVTLPEF